MKLAVAVLFLIAAGSAPGCGSSDGDGAGSGGSGAGSSGAAGSGGGAAGSGGGGASPPDIAPERPIDELTDAERGALCDWGQGLRGGYGQSHACEGLNVVYRTYDNQAICVQFEFPEGCGLTVGDWIACAEAIAPSYGCQFPPECEEQAEC